MFTLTEGSASYGISDSKRSVDFGLETEELDLNLLGSQVDLELAIDISPGKEMDLTFIGAKDLFADDTIGRISANFKTFLFSILFEPNPFINNATLISEVRLSILNFY